MSGEPVTRDELKAMVDVQSKNVEQLTVIANHLATIVDRENKIYERLYNGLSKEISAAIISSVDKVHELVAATKDGQANQCAAAKENFGDMLEEKLSNCGISKDIGHVKWFVGAVGLIIIVSSVIVNGLVRNSANAAQTQDIKAIVQHFEQDILHKGETK